MSVVEEYLEKKELCNCCGTPLNDAELESLEFAGYDPEDEAWCCSLCSYLIFK